MCDRALACKARVISMTKRFYSTGLSSFTLTITAVLQLAAAATDVAVEAAATWSKIDSSLTTSVSDVFADWSGSKKVLRRPVLV
jgi:hypothetical protein